MPSPARTKRSRRQRQLEERSRLEKERNRLKSELAAKEKLIGSVEQVRTDAGTELQRLNLELRDSQDTYEMIRQQATHDLFQDMLASPAQISLLKLLTLEQDTDLRWLLPLAYYLQDHIGLVLVGEKDQHFLLTEENCDEYVIHDPVSLPCEVQIVKRGFAIGETVLVRPEVTPLSEDH